MENRYFNILGLAIILAGMICAQQPNRSVAPPLSETPNLPLQRIGVDDLIGISVYDAPELTRTIRVGAEGTMRLPMLKHEIKACGLFPSELERVIAQTLMSEDVLVNPIVTVSVVEYRSRPISVVGAVKRPTAFQAVGAVTLLDALAHAEGLSENAGAEILVTRMQADAGHQPVSVMKRIPVKELIEGNNAELNIHLVGGEEVRVPDAGRVYVVGNVRKPGAFVIRDTSQTTVLKVLALSEGLMPYATKLAYIYRQEGAGGKQEIPVELKQIMSRKSPDVVLMANDVLYIPDRAGKRNLATVLERVVSLSGGLGAAAIYTTH